ncbi:metal cation symporter ZIP8-like [Rhopilema esculentum]|uniref:metal cation symporter ZIP8-like n=1 Tax=Rhopilema esculentum TaxID=499914 RepID=UPI0031D09D71
MRERCCKRGQGFVGESGVDGVVPSVNVLRGKQTQTKRDENSAVVKMFLLNLLSASLLFICHGIVAARTNSLLELGPPSPNSELSRSRKSIVPSCGVDFVYKHFATNGSLTRSELKTLIDALSGKDVIEVEDRSCRKCLTPDEVFNSNGYQKERYLNKAKFEKICPSLLQQIIEKPCNAMDDVELSDKPRRKVESGKAWGFGILSVTIISLASMLGAFIVPLMNKALYKKLLLFMVSLAVGVLGGSGVFHLIPNAFGMGSDGGKTYFWKCSTIVGGIYFFFVTENIMKIYIRFAEWRRRKISRNGINLSINEEAPGKELCHLVATDNVHEDHALDSVHVSDRNCQHEHGVDSLNMAGDHCINKKNASEYFKDGDSNKGFSILERVAPVAWMIILGDGLHNFIDGLAIGVSFTNDIVEGISTSLAIFCEELPHELGDFAILLNSGLSYKQAIIANFLSACTCYIGMVIGTVLGSTTQIVKWIYALAAGMFLYISLVDMLPEATGMQVTISATSKKETIKNFIIVNIAIILGYSAMFLLAIYAENIKI